MTREEFLKLIDKFDWNAGYPWKHELSYLRDHDAEQRQTIAKLQKQLSQWDEFSKRDVYQALVDARAANRRLKNDPDYQQCCEIREQQAQEIARLRKVLESIAQNTCCGPCQEAKRVAQAALERTTG